MDRRRELRPSEVCLDVPLSGGGGPRAQLNRDRTRKELLTSLRIHLYYPGVIREFGARRVLRATALPQQEGNPSRPPIYNSCRIHDVLHFQLALIMIIGFWVTTCSLVVVLANIKDKKSKPMVEGPLEQDSMRGKEPDVTVADEATESVQKSPEFESGDHYFEDQYTFHYGPRQLEFGHVAEDPKRWELRYERKDHDNIRHQGKVVED
ncbi:hypothetical protein AAG570_009153 [Ranatra chinensis]|uniref:Uncharacterized protein n=1 Tax=Ranatra chinensis TaxID=642074 RepID=A0ABD0Z3J7_9HEMI